MQFIQNVKKNKINHYITQYLKNFNPLLLVDLLSSLEIFESKRIAHLREFFNLEYTRKIKFAKQDKLIEELLSKKASKKSQGTMLQINLISVLKQRKKWLQTIIKQAEKNRFQLSLDFLLIKINKIIKPLTLKYDIKDNTEYSQQQIQICNNFVESENQKPEKTTAQSRSREKITLKPPMSRFYFDVDLKTPPDEDEYIVNTLLTQQNFLEQNQQEDLLNNSLKQFKEGQNSASYLILQNQNIVPIDISIKSKVAISQMEKPINKADLVNNTTIILEASHHNNEKINKKKSRYNIASQPSLSFHNRNKNKIKNTTLFRKKVSFKNYLQISQDQQHTQKQYSNKISQNGSRNVISFVQPITQKTKNINRIKGHPKISHNFFEYNKKIAKDKEKIIKSPLYSRHINAQSANKVNTTQEHKNQEEEPKREKSRNQMILQKIYQKYEAFNQQENALTFKELRQFLYESFQDLKHIPQFFTFSQTTFYDLILTKASNPISNINKRKVTFDDLVDLINYFKKQIPQMQKAHLQKQLELYYDNNYIPFHRKTPKKQASIMIKKPVSMELRKWRKHQNQLISRLIQRKQDQLIQKALSSKIEFLDIKPNHTSFFWKKQKRFRV